VEAEAEAEAEAEVEVEIAENAALPDIFGSKYNIYKFLSNLRVERKKG
jgi:hypothetical protein